MAVPLDLRQIVRRRMWRQYLGTITETEARVAALTLALKFKQEIERLRRSLVADRAEIARPNGVNDHDAMTLGEARGQPANLDRGANGSPQLAAPARKTNGADTPSPAGQNPIEMIDHQPEEGVADLVEVWRRTAQPRAAKSVQRMRHTARLFTQTVGDIEPRKVTRQDVMRFRDAVEGMELSRRSATQYLELVHRLFAIALSEGLVDHNPAAGIKIRKTAGRFADSQRRRPFEPRQIRSLFSAMADEEEAFKWIVKICAYHGMRSGEVAQLRVEDVTTLFGVPALRVHDRFGSIKNRFSQRDVPLHPGCAELATYARAVAGPWLFEPDKWRADRFQRHASVFLRTKAGLADPTLTMHSLRHTWRTLAREIGMPASVSRAIMGHSMGRDVHEAYGAGPSLRLMADWMARIDPLALTSTSLPRADAQSRELPFERQPQQSS